jgi:hypothetical protein
LVNPAAVQGLHGSLSGTGVVKLHETIVVALGGELALENNKVRYGLCFLPEKRQQLVEYHGVLSVHTGDARCRGRPSGGLTFLSGMIFTLSTWPVVSKICFKMSSVTLGSSPPT